MPPPLVVAELPEIVELEMSRLPAFQIPPPAVPAVLMEKVELVTVRVPNKLKMPPPAKTAELLERVVLVRLRVPLLSMPPPFKAEEFPEMVELVTVRVPRLLKAPPLPEVCAPETVTPEMDKLPPEAMLKMLKLRLVSLLLPLMISEVAPRPLMVTVPAVPPPVIGVLASTIVGSAEFSVIV